MAFFQNVNNPHVATSCPQSRPNKNCRVEKKIACVHSRARACVFLARPVCLLQPQRRNTPASRVARHYSLGSDDHRILPGMHHGRMSCWCRGGWIRRFMRLNIHSHTPRHHIQNSHLPHMFTQLRFLVYHTPVGQENSTLTPIILVFISVLMIPGGFGSFPFPTFFSSLEGTAEILTSLDCLCV